MLETRSLRIADIYVPAARRRALDPARVEALATDMLEEGQKTPILVRAGKGRFVLVDGAHRLEAGRALGEETILAILVQARRH
ncbi:MAG: ParB N-terminal domain-containing protein [Rhodothalassiaceae bacterium]